MKAPKHTVRFMVALFLLFCLNVAAQVFLHRGDLNNEILTASMPGEYDGLEYVERAEALARGGGFVSAFRDGYRLPGYPAFLAMFYPLTDRALLMARHAQIVLSALAIVFAGLTLLRVLGSRRWALAGGIFVALWYPFYHFSPLLYAESASFFLLALLLYALSRIGHGPAARLAWLGPPALTAALVFLKPNHVFLMLPVLAYLLLLPQPRGWRRAGGYAAVTLALLLPWSAFVSYQNGSPVFLGTSSGVNLYKGTGAQLYSMESGTLFFKFARMTGKFPVIELDEYHVAPDTVVTKAQQNAYFSRLAKDIWKERPLATAFYGAGKVLHGFGFSLRGARDFAFAGLFALSALLSALLWRAPAFRSWAGLYGGCLLVTALQFFVYLPNHRLRVVLFDLPALFVIVAGFFVLRERFNATRRRTPQPGSDASRPSPAPVSNRS